MSDQNRTQRIPLTFVFNSPVLVPWSVVEPFQKNLNSSDEDIKEQAIDDAREKILLWQEAHQSSHRFKESNEVCEMNNPFLKMTIRRIIRQTVNEGTAEEKKRLIGMECYWWVTADEASTQILRMSNRGTQGRLVPGASILETEV